MSYDIAFKVKVEGIDQYVPVGSCEANITWNVRKIIELSTGLPWLNEENNGFCKDVIPKIADGLAELHKNPGKYYPYEAKNGWVNPITEQYISDVTHWMPLPNPPKGE